MKYTAKDFQNPEQLTRQQVGEEYRLLLPEECDGRFGCVGQKLTALFTQGSWITGGSLGNWKYITYRVPLATPLPDGTVLSSNECCWAETEQQEDAHVSSIAVEQAVDRIADLLAKRGDCLCEVMLYRDRKDGWSVDAGNKSAFVLLGEVSGVVSVEGSSLAEALSKAEKALLSESEHLELSSINEQVTPANAEQPQQPHDEWAEEKAAYAAGKTIQYRSPFAPEWEDVPYPAWYPKDSWGRPEYRIKPEPKQRIYVAGPMSGQPDFNFPLFFKAEALLRSMGYDVVNPAALDEAAGYTLEKLKHLHATNPEEWHEFLEGAMMRDLTELAKCDAIVLLPGWESSKGATAEKAVAEWGGKRIGYLLSDEEDGDYVAWDTGDSKPSTQPRRRIARKETQPREPDADGWIKHVPGEPMPCDGDDLVDVTLANGESDTSGTPASFWWWGLNAFSGGITAWRHHKPQEHQENPEYTDAPYSATELKFRPNPCSTFETSEVRWEYEDKLPEMDDSDFDAIFKASRVDWVRMYPFVEDSKGNRIWITGLSSQNEIGEARAESATSPQDQTL